MKFAAYRRVLQVVVGACHLASMMMMVSSLLAQSAAPSPAVSLPAAAPTSQPTQTATSPSASTRLQRLEDTYQNNLRVLDVPLTRDYVRDLETLKQSLASQSRTTEVADVDAEIARVKQLAATTGVLTFEPPRPPPSPKMDRPPPGKPKSPMDRLGAGAVVLSAPDAAPPPTPGSNAVSLGKIAWKVPHLTAGNYDVMVLYACSKVDGGSKLKGVFNDDTISRPLATAQDTGSEQNFRLLRLGQITVSKDLSDAPFTLQIDPASSTPFWVRSVVFAKPKPKP